MLPECSHLCLNDQNFLGIFFNKPRFLLRLSIVSGLPSSLEQININMLMTRNSTRSSYLVNMDLLSLLTEWRFYRSVLIFRGSEREKHKCESTTLISCFLHALYLGSSPLSRHVPLSGYQTSNLQACGSIVASEISEVRLLLFENFSQYPTVTT